MGLLTIGEYVRKDRSYVKYECTVCGYSGEMRKDHYENGVGCSVCNGKTVLPGYNDVISVRPDLVLYFDNEEDASKSI